MNNIKKCKNSNSDKITTAETQKNSTHSLKKTT